MKKEHANEQQMQPYWDLYHGLKRSYSTMPKYATGLVDIFVSEGKAVRQYDIFGDSLVWFPKYLNEILKV